MGRCVLSDCVPFPIMAAPAPLTPGVATQVTTFASNRPRLRHGWLDFGARLVPLQDELETSFLQPVLQGVQTGAMIQPAVLHTLAVVGKGRYLGHYIRRKWGWSSMIANGTQSDSTHRPIP